MQPEGPPHFNSACASCNDWNDDPPSIVHLAPPRPPPPVTVAGPPACAFPTRPSSSLPSCKCTDRWWSAQTPSTGGGPRRKKG